jgi:hypothetical protein
MGLEPVRKYNVKQNSTVVLQKWKHLRDIFLSMPKKFNLKYDDYFVASRILSNDVQKYVS